MVMTIRKKHAHNFRPILDIQHSINGYAFHHTRDRFTDAVCISHMVYNIIYPSRIRDDLHEKTTHTILHSHRIDNGLIERLLQQDKLRPLWPLIKLLFLRFLSKLQCTSISVFFLDYTRQFRPIYDMFVMGISSRNSSSMLSTCAQLFYSHAFVWFFLFYFMLCGAQIKSLSPRTMIHVHIHTICVQKYLQRSLCAKLKAKSYTSA